MSTKTKNRVTGLGGVFFKAQQPDKLYEWYEKHLGIGREEGGVSIFRWRDDEQPDKRAMTIWSIFPRSTEYFGSDDQTFMLNYRVADLEAVLAALKEEGVEIDPRREDSEYGRFAWIIDPEGNRIELWEPPEE